MSNNACVSAEALKYLVELGVERKPGFVKLPDCFESDQYAWINPDDGELMVQTVKRPKSWTAASLTALAEMLVDQHNEQTRVFVGIDEVTVLLRSDGRDRIYLPLAPADEWLALTSTIDKNAQTQERLIQVLRTRLSGTRDASGLLRLVRTMRLENASNSESSIGAGMQTIDKAARRKALLGGAEPPDTVVFRVARYEALMEYAELVFDIPCAFDLNLMSGEITLSVEGGAIAAANEKASRFVQRKLIELLGDKAIPVWCGTP